MELWTKDLGTAQERFWALLNCQLIDITAPYSAVGTAQTLLFWGDALSLPEQPLCSRLCQLCPCFVCGIAGRWHWRNSALTGMMPTPHPSLPFPRTLNPAWGESRDISLGDTLRKVWDQSAPSQSRGVTLVQLFCAPPHTKGWSRAASSPFPPHPGRMSNGRRRGSDLDSYLYFGPKPCIYTIFYVPFFLW